MLSCLQVVNDLNIDIFIREIRNITLLNVTTLENGRKLESGKSQRYAPYLSTGPLLTGICDVVVFYALSFVCVQYIKILLIFYQTFFLKLNSSILQSLKDSTLLSHVSCC
jgi:hypothetical protein